MPDEYRVEVVGEAANGREGGWDRRLREALVKDHFYLVSQPILDLRSGRTEMYELLLRLRGEAGEEILPSVFLGVAESSGLIGAVDRWVVVQAIRRLARWQRAGSALRMAVNLSGKSFTGGELLLRIEDELRATGADPNGLKTPCNCFVPMGWPTPRAITSAVRALLRRCRRVSLAPRRFPVTALRLERAVVRLPAGRKRPAAIY